VHALDDGVGRQHEVPHTGPHYRRVVADGHDDRGIRRREDAADRREQVVFGDVHAFLRAGQALTSVG
jgi:hypothetical protein